MSVTEFFSRAPSQTSAGFCFACNPVVTKFENTVVKTPQELADDFAQAFNLAQLDINVLTVCLQGSQLPGYFTEFQIVLAHQLRSRLRIFAFLGEKMLLLNETLENRTNEPVKCQLQRSKDGSLEILQADNYIEENYEIIGQLDFNMLKFMPQCVLLELSSEGKYMRFYVVLTPEGVTNLNDLKSAGEEDLENSFRLGPEFLFVVPFLQSAGFFKEIEFCSFYDNLRELGQLPNPLVHALTHPVLFTKIAFGLQNALNCLLFDAFYIRKTHIVSFACDKFLVEEGDRQAFTDDLLQIAAIFEQIAIGAANGSCILQHSSANSENIVLARSRFLYELVRRKMQEITAENNNENHESQILEFSSAAKVNVKQIMSPSPHGKRAASGLKEPLKQLEELGNGSYDEEIADLTARLEQLRHEQRQESLLLQGDESELLELEEENAEIEVEKQFRAQSELVGALENLEEQVEESQYINFQLVREIADLDKKLSVVQEPSNLNVIIVPDQLELLEIERRKAQIDSELREEFTERLNRLKYELKNQK